MKSEEALIALYWSMYTLRSTKQSYEQSKFGMSCLHWLDHNTLSILALLSIVGRLWIWRFVAWQSTQLVLTYPNALIDMWICKLYSNASTFLYKFNIFAITKSVFWLGIFLVHYPSDSWKCWIGFTCWQNFVSRLHMQYDHSCLLLWNGNDRHPTWSFFMPSNDQQDG